MTHSLTDTSTSRTTSVAVWNIATLMRVFEPTELYEHLLAHCSDNELDNMENWLTAVLQEFTSGGG